MKTLFYDDDYPKHLELLLAGVFMAIASFLESVCYKKIHLSAVVHSNWCNYSYFIHIY